MKNKDNLLQNLHKIVRDDPYIIALFQSVGIELDKLDKKLKLINNEYLFSTMSLTKINLLEKILNYKTKAKSIEYKRLEIESRWKTQSKCDIELLQNIAETYKVNTCIVKFIEAGININFISPLIPKDINNLVKAINEAKPAHLPIGFKATIEKDIDYKVKAYKVMNIIESRYNRKTNIFIKNQNYIIAYKQIVGGVTK